MHICCAMQSTYTYIVHEYTRIYWICQECQVYRSQKYYIKIIKRSLAYTVF